MKLPDSETIHQARINAIQSLAEERGGISENRALEEWYELDREEREDRLWTEINLLQKRKEAV